MSNNFIWLINRTLSGATTPDQSGPRSTPYSPKIQDWSLTIKFFCVISRTLVGVVSYSSAEILFVYSIAPAEWARFEKEKQMKHYQTVEPQTCLCILMVLKLVQMRIKYPLNLKWQPIRKDLTVHEWIGNSRWAKSVNSEIPLSELV